MCTVISVSLVQETKGKSLEEITLMLRSGVSRVPSKDLDDFVSDAPVVIGDASSSDDSSNNELLSRPTLRTPPPVQDGRSAS